MSDMVWSEIIASAGAAGPTLANTTVATSIIPPVCKEFLHSNFFKHLGKCLRVSAAGRISTLGSAPGTFTFSLRLGSTTVWTFTTPTLAVSASNLTWLLNLDLKCRSVGSGTSATLIGTGTLVSAAISPTTPILTVPSSSPAVGSGFDGTSAHAVDLFGAWSVADAANSLTLEDYTLTSGN